MGGVSYHDYCGILIDEAEKESIKDDLGSENMVGKSCFINQNVLISSVFHYCVPPSVRLSLQ